MKRLTWLAFTLGACTATPAPSPPQAPSAPVTALSAKIQTVPGPAATAETRGPPSAALESIAEQLAPLLQPPMLNGDGEGWLDGRTSLRPLAPRCWKIERERMSGQQGERVKVLQQHGLGPNELRCASGPTGSSQVATLFVAHPGAPLTWRSPNGSATLAALLVERNRGLLRAVARLRARLDEAGVAWDDTVRFRVDGEAETFVDVTVVDAARRGQDIATFRVERATDVVGFIRPGEHNAAVLPLASFENEWFRAHPPAITALQQALQLDWSSCRSFRVEAAHGSYFDVVAELSAECAENGPKDPQHFRVDFRTGTLSWKKGERHVPLTELHQQVADLSERAAKLFEKWLRRHPRYKQLECPGILPSGVSGSNVSIRLYVAPPCNQSPLLMTLGWFRVDVRTGRVTCEGPCP